MFPDDLPPGGERSSGFWDLSNLLPVPRNLLSCPFCGADLVLKDWKFHKRTAVGSRSPWRCDTRLKCMDCGFVPTFGVLIPQRMFSRSTKQFGVNRWVHWRTGREAMRAVDNGSASDRRQR